MSSPFTSLPFIWDTTSCNAWRGAVVGEGSLEFDPLADGQQHIAFCYFSCVLSSSFLPELTLKMLLVGQGHIGRIGCSLTTPWHHGQSVSIPSSGKCWRRWAFSSSSSSSHLLCAPAAINRCCHIRHRGDLYWDDRCTYRDGARAPNWAWTAGRRFRRGGAAYCGNPRCNYNWSVACGIGDRSIMEWKKTGPETTNIILGSNKTDYHTYIWCTSSFTMQLLLTACRHDVSLKQATSRVKEWKYLSVHIELWHSVQCVPVGVGGYGPVWIGVDG